MNFLKQIRLLVLGATCCALAVTARATESFHWEVKQRCLSAEVNSLPLPKLLEKVAEITGWQVYVEPGAGTEVSAKFRDLPIGDALRSLLGKLNFALVPKTNSPSELYVFETTLDRATQLVAVKSRPHPKGAKPIPNELVITIKPGASIDVIAAAIGARVIGRADGLNTYRLQFDSAEAAAAALSQLTANSDVASVDFNYSVGGEPAMQQVSASSGGDLPMKAKAIGEGGKVTVGLIDTGGDYNDYCGLSGFMLPPIDEAGVATPQGSSPNHGPSMANAIIQGMSTVNKTGASSVRILPVNVYGANATTTTYDVGVGIYQAVNAGANPINLSLGSPGDSTFLSQVIANAHAQGVVFFAAAGNEPVTTPTYPAAYPEVVAVTASTKPGTLADYANRGSFVDVAAPGNDVVCFNGDSWLVQGTSASTAKVTGIAAGLGETSGASSTVIEQQIRNSNLAVKLSGQ